MGCWNGTCGLTHLPILAGDKVRAYILVPKNYDYPHLYKDDSSEKYAFAGAGITYSTDEFHPLTYGIKGEYNDYGGIQKIKKDENTKAILAYFNKKIKSGAMITYVPEDFSKDRQPIDKFTKIDDLLYSIQRSGIRDTKLPFGYVMILESAFQTATKAIDNQESSGWRKVSRKEMRAEVEAYATSKRELNQFKSDESKDSIKKMVKLMSEVSNREIFSNGESRKINHLFGLDHLDNLLAELSPVIIDDVTDHLMFCRAMEGLRRTWVCQAGSGSQSEEWRTHRIMAEFVLAHVSEQKKKHERDVNMSIPEEREFCDSLY